MWSLRGVHTFSAVSLSLPVWASFVCSGTYHSSNVARLHKALQIRLSARECVVFPRMVRPSPISGDNKRQPWSLREISKIREKRGELGWLRVTSLAENFVRNFGSLVSLRLNEWQAICGKQMSQTATAEKAFPHRGRSYIQQTGRVNPP